MVSVADELQAKFKDLDHSETGSAILNMTDFIPVSNLGYR